MGYIIVGIIWVISLIVAFVAGIFVYRNNAIKFKAIEDQAKAKGQSVEDFVKTITK